MERNKYKENLYKYLDGEMDEAHKQEFEKQLVEDPILKLEYEKEKKFDQILRDHIIKEEAPFELRESIINSLDKKSKILPGLFGPTFSLKPVIVGFICLVLMTSVFLTKSNAFPVFNESISRHVQCLKGQYPIEIQSDNINEVSKWFRGKLDFAVKVPDLSKRKYDLVGARLCHLKDKKVGLIFYEKNDRRMSVFVMDAKGMKIPSSKKTEAGSKTIYSKSESGYQSALCLDSQYEGVGCVFVSDISEQDMIDLVAKL